MNASLADRLQKYIAEREPGSRITDFRYLASGFESDVYEFILHLPGGETQPLILRQYAGGGAAEKEIREAAGMGRLFQAGYPVPKVFHHEVDSAILGQPFITIEKLNGRPLWPVLAGEGREESAGQLYQFGALLASLHRLDWREFTGNAALYEEKPERLLGELFAASRRLYEQFDVPGFLSIVDWLESHQPMVAVRPAVVHLDFHANNVFLRDDGRLAVIDWTQVTVADYRTDLCWTLMIMGDYGQPGWREVILQGYQSAADWAVEQLDYFNVITYAKLLASTVISLKTSPQELGMRAETAASAKNRAPVLARLSERIRAITGLTIPEVADILDQAG